MPRVTVVRYIVKPEYADENEALARAVFAELEELKPQGVSYALFRDGRAFLHLFVNARADDADVLTGLPAFKAYQAQIGERCENPPDVQRSAMTLLEAYGLSAAQR
jgi:hypothetical protein